MPGHPLLLRDAEGESIFTRSAFRVGYNGNYMQIFSVFKAELESRCASRDIEIVRWNDGKKGPENYFFTPDGHVDVGITEVLGFGRMLVYGRDAEQNNPNVLETWRLSGE